MPLESDEGVREAAVHATAVATDHGALMILGRSRAGKSALAWSLMVGEPGFVLVGDDRILLSRTGSAILARPHPRTAGFIERRGVGFVAVPWREPVPVVAVIRLAPDQAGTDDARMGWLVPLPHLDLTAVDGTSRRREVVSDWWWDRRAAPDAGKPRPAEHTDRANATSPHPGVEIWNW